MLVHGHPQPVAPKRVLILGAGGFLSPHLQRALTAAAISHRALGRAELDLTQPAASAALAGTIAPDDTVVMLAALTPDRGRDFTALMGNLRMAETVCRALETARCRHFVYVSSDAVYGGRKTPLDENSAREPGDLYALAHTAREMMLGSVLLQRDIPACVLRPTALYGAGDTHDGYGVNRFCRTAVREGRIVLFGRGEERRSHLHVRDAVDLILRTIRQRSSGTLNLAAERAVSFKRVAEIVIRGCPGPVQLEFSERPVRPGQPAVPILHRPYAVSAILGSFPDFKYTPLAEGIADLLQTLRSSRP